MKPLRGDFDVERQESRRGDTNGLRVDEITDRDR